MVGELKVFVLEVPEHKIVVVAESRKDAVGAVREELEEMLQALLHEDNTINFTDGKVH